MSVVRSPARSSRIATAVPNEPAPTTVARRGWLERRRERRMALRLLVVRAVPALGRCQPATLRGDRPALHAVGRRDLKLDLARAVDSPVLLGLLERLLRHLVDLGRA